ncbi:MAG: leucyl aminopeptidase [Myxococcota bacterium]
MMKFSLHTDFLLEAPVDLVALPVFADQPDWGPVFAQVDRALDGVLARCCEDEDFKGRPGQTVVVTTPAGRAIRRVLVVGLGEKARATGESARAFAGHAARNAVKVSAQSVALQVPDIAAEPEELLRVFQALAEGAELGAYRYDDLRTREVRPVILEDVRLAFQADDVAGLESMRLRDMVERGQAVAEAVRFARDLTNLPANLLTPNELAERARKLAKNFELGWKVLGPREMEKQNMNLHLGVGQGSRNEPRLIHLTYEPNDRKTAWPTLVLVGKGLTFDSGGLSLKTGEGMVEMKIDMGGAAAVLGAMQAIASVKPNLVVHGVVGAAENMPDGNAIRPGDVITGKKGISVEILNTDAEGRLVLADALAYAQDLKPNFLVDLATLTGACMVALGRQRAGAYYQDGPMKDLIETAWERSGELFWRLPLASEIKEVLRSDIADIKNVGDRWGGSITAALFLKEFVDPKVPWAHLDIAGPVSAANEQGHVPKGGTGFGVRTLLELALRIAEPAD